MNNIRIAPLTGLLIFNVLAGLLIRFDAFDRPLFGKAVFPTLGILCGQSLHSCAIARYPEDLVTASLSMLLTSEWRRAAPGGPRASRGGNADDKMDGSHAG